MSTDVLRRDLRTAWRSLIGAPSFSIAAVLLIALAVGVNTAVFTLINALLLRPLPVSAPDELAFIWRLGPAGVQHGLAPYDEVMRFLDRSDVFKAGAAVDLDTANLRIGLDVEPLTGERVTPRYFDVLGVAPTLGRALTPADAEPSAERVVVLSHSLWRRRFNSSPDVIGRRISLGTRLFMSEAAPAYRVVGVMAPEFTGVANRVEPTEYWVELSKREEETFGLIVNRTARTGMAVARLKPGVTRDHVRALAAVALPAQEVVVPADGAARAAGPIVEARPLARLPFGASVSPSRLSVGLLLVAGVVLAIAATNLSGLLVTRNVSRQKDAAIRLALGATAWDIARAITIETILLALMGGLLGLGLSRLVLTTAIDSLTTGFGDTAARFASLGMPIDGRVVLFTVVLAVVMGIAVSLGAMQRGDTGSRRLADAHGLSQVGPGRSRLRHWILVPQLALTTALLVVALGAMRALLNVALVDSGYEASRAAYLKFEGLYQPLQRLSVEQRSTYSERMAGFPARIMTLATADARFEAVSFATRLPNERPAPAPMVAETTDASGPLAFGSGLTQVTPAYFRAIGVPVLQGRAFEEDDLAANRQVAVVDERLAARLWPGQSAVGKRIARLEGTQSSPTWHEVVGVVGSMRASLSEGETYSVVYMPWPRRPVQELILIGRGRVSDRELLKALRELSMRADEHIGILDARMVQDDIDQHRYPRRLAAQLLGLCALGGLMLGATGVYGTLSFSLAQRTRELAIRAALGANPSTLVRLVFADTALVVSVSAIGGVCLAVLGSRIASHLVLPLPTIDVVTMVVALAVLCATAMVGSLVPSMRAAGADPVRSLRV